MRLLIVTGRVVEPIDGVRVFANLSRTGCISESSLKSMNDSGFETEIFEVGDRIISAHELRARIADYSGKLDAVLQLAVLPGLRAHAVSEQKLKKKPEMEDYALDVVGAGGILPVIAACGMQCAGYDEQQRWRPAPFAPAAIEELPALPVQSKAAVPGAIIVSAGPTAEIVTQNGDVLTNLSSGAQGAAIALALAQLGEQVQLIAGVTSCALPNHPLIHLTQVRTAEEMRQACLACLPAKAYIGVAAVADFALNGKPMGSLEEGACAKIALRTNPDILAQIAAHPSLRPRVVAGFAAETHALEDYARDKLRRKKLDVIFANPVGGRAQQALSQGFNQITMIDKDLATQWPQMDKKKAAEQIAEEIMRRLGR